MYCSHYSNIRAITLRMKISVQQRETSTEQQVQFFTDWQREASIEAALSHGVESDRESQSNDFGDSKNACHNSGCLKVAAAAALAGISCDFGSSNILKPHVGSMDSYSHYLPISYGQPPVWSLC
jgi:hypothetical protein